MDDSSLLRKDWLDTLHEQQEKDPEWFNDIREMRAEQRDEDRRMQSERYERD